MGEVTFLDVSKRFSLRVDGELHHVQALDRVSLAVDATNRFLVLANYSSGTVSVLGACT